MTAAHRTGRRASELLIALFVAIGAAPLAQAQTAPEGAPAAIAVSQRRFGFGPTAGFLSGNGVVMGGGGDVVRGWFTGGYMPIVVFGNARTPDKAVRLNYYNSLQINEDLAFHLFRRPRLEGALLVGYKYNTVLGHGGGAGVGVLYDLDARVGLQIAVGLAVFPSAKDRLVRDHGYPTDRDPSFPPAIQGGGNIGLVFFP
jgi:hypothetical protein